MKVLWFSNTPAAAEDYLRKDNLAGGWLYSLDKAIQGSIDLNIAFYSKTVKEAFIYNQTKYFPIYIKQDKFEKLKNIWLIHEKNQEDLYKYLNIIEVVKPDIIHIHGTENPFGCIIDLIDIPCIVSIQGNITVYHHKFLSGIDERYLKVKNDYFSLKGLLSRGYLVSYIKFKLRSKIELTNLKKTKFVVGRTEWDKRIMSVMAPSAKYFKCNEILRDNFYNYQWVDNYIDKVIIYTTNGEAFYKGFETLCYALSILNKLNYIVEWRVAGINENSLINKIVKSKLKENYPAKGLNLLGQQKEEDVIHLLLESHLYVMPSHIENSPNNLCEAMMLGLPCIATFAGGTSSMLEDRREGILIQDGDPWSLAGAIIELIEDRDKACCMGQNARFSALNRHNQKAIVNQLLTIYNAVLENN